MAKSNWTGVQRSHSGIDRVTRSSHTQSLLAATATTAAQTLHAMTASRVMRALVACMLLAVLALTHTTAAATAADKKPAAVPRPSSLHAGDAASAARLDSLTQRMGVHVPRAPAAGRQDRRLEHEQSVLLDVVSRVLNSRAHEHRVERPFEREGEGDAAAMEEEFAMMNALMEKQSELREFDERSNERTHIGGVSRQFLQSVTDQAVNKSVQTRQQRRTHANGVRDDV